MKSKQPSVIEAAVAESKSAAPPAPTLLTEAEFILLPDVEAMTAAEIAEELSRIVDPTASIQAAAEHYRRVSAEADAAISKAQRERDAAYAALAALQNRAVLTFERLNRLRRVKPRRPRRS